MPLLECTGKRAKYTSVQKSSTSNKVIGKQSLSSRTKLMPGNMASKYKGARPSGMHLMQPSRFEVGEEQQFCFLPVRSYKLEATVPPSCCCRSVW